MLSLECSSHQHWDETAPANYIWVHPFVSEQCRRYLWWLMLSSSVSLCHGNVHYCLQWTCCSANFFLYPALRFLTSLALTDNWCKSRSFRLLNCLLVLLCSLSSISSTNSSSIYLKSICETMTSRRCSAMHRVACFCKLYIHKAAGSCPRRLSMYQWSFDRLATCWFSKSCLVFERRLVLEPYLVNDRNDVR